MNGRVHDSFLKKHSLSVYSTPADFVAAFLPFKSNLYSTQKKEYPTFDLFARWTNLKATLAGAGEGGICYHEWKLFSPRELCQHFSIYIFNGLSPSPRLENKFRPHSENPVHGNDLVYHLYGPNIEQCHQYFTRFLAVQDPGIDIPAKNKYPYW